MIAKKIRKEARRYKVSADDLADAVSVLQYEQRGMKWNAKEYREKIENESVNLWRAAQRVFDFIELLEN